MTQIPSLLKAFCQEEMSFCLKKQRAQRVRLAYIQMKVFDNYITLWNPGVLPDGFTVETLFQPHESRPRNRLIANIFYLAGFIESWDMRRYAPSLRLPLCRCLHLRLPEEV